MPQLNLRTASVVMSDSVRIIGAQSSDLKSASGVISAIPGVLTGLNVTTDGTNDATAILYDNASAASGVILAKQFVKGVSGNGAIHLPCPVLAANGIYLSLTGTGAGAVTWFVI